MFVKQISYISRLMQVLKHSIFVSWILYTAIYVSLIIYYWFYTWYLPTAKIQSNIMFELQYKIDNQFDKHYELVGNVDLYNEHGQYLYHGQEYTFLLELDLPESETNFNVGLFGITADLYDLDDKISASFRTTGTLKYRSTLLRYITTLVQLPFFLFGSREQKQNLNIVLKDGYIENSFSGASKLVLKIHDKVQFYAAKLSVQAKFTGLRYYMYNWCYTTGFLICSLLVSFIFLILITYFYDFKSFIITNMSNKPNPSKTKIFDIYESENDDRNIAFVTTTAGELKNFLKNNDTNDNQNVLIGIENFRRRNTKNIFAKKDE